MRGYVTTLVVFFSLVYAALADGTVTGTITDRDSKKPLVGATVALLPINAEPGYKVKYGAYVGKNGIYHIDGVPEGSWTVRVTFVGFKHATRVVEVVNDKEVEASFEMAYDPKRLDEVVVTGMASQHPKTEAQVAVSRVDADALQQANVYTDMSQLLMGKVAGVQIESSSGNVGGGQRFTVRGGGGLNGSGSPLVFVDGARIESG